MRLLLIIALLMVITRCSTSTTSPNNSIRSYDNFDFKEWNEFMWPGCIYKKKDQARIDKILIEQWLIQFQKQYCVSDTWVRLLSLMKYLGYFVYTVLTTLLIFFCIKTMIDRIFDALKTNVGRQNRPRALPE